MVDRTPASVRHSAVSARRRLAVSVRRPSARAPRPAPALFRTTKATTRAISAYVFSSAMRRPTASTTRPIGRAERISWSAGTRFACCRILPGSTSRVRGTNLDERNGQRREYLLEIQYACIVRLPWKEPVREDVAKLVALEPGRHFHESLAPTLADGRTGSFTETGEKAPHERDRCFVSSGAGKRDHLGRASPFDVAPFVAAVTKKRLVRPTKPESQRRDEQLDATILGPLEKLARERRRIAFQSRQQLVECPMAVREIHGAAVVGIDQVEAPVFRPLVEVGNARRRHLQQH